MSTVTKARVLPLSPDERAEIDAMLADGKSCAAICDWIGCSPAQVRARMTPQVSDAGNFGAMNANRIAISQEREKRVLALLSTYQHTTAELAQTIGCTYCAMDNTMRNLRRNGVVRLVAGGRNMALGEKKNVWAVAE